LENPQYGLRESWRRRIPPPRERDDWQDAASPNDPENPNRVFMDGEIEAWQQNAEQAGGMKDIAVLSPTQYGMSISPK
jgi:hypothetical protein